MLPYDILAPGTAFLRLSVEMTTG